MDKINNADTERPTYWRNELGKEDDERWGRTAVEMRNVAEAVDPRPLSSGNS